MNINELYATPKNVTGPEEAWFYHTMDLPIFGTVEGEWDLRGREADYLGHVYLKGKSVLEIGTASGHLCFYMEKSGATVTAFDLSSDLEWDMVPYAAYDYSDAGQAHMNHIKRVHNSYWLAHKLFKSQAKVVYGTVYNIPRELGSFDLGVMGSIILHLRDPFLVLQNVARLVTETIVVSDIDICNEDMFLQFAALQGNKILRFLPNSETLEPKETWWVIAPELIAEYLKVLGFKYTHISFHKQKHTSGYVPCYTVVGSRCEISTVVDIRNVKGSDEYQRFERDKIEEKVLSRIRFFVILKHMSRRLIQSLKRRLSLH